MLQLATSQSTPNTHTFRTRAKRAIFHTQTEAQSKRSYRNFSPFSAFVEPAEAPHHATPAKPPGPGEQLSAGRLGSGALLEGTIQHGDQRAVRKRRRRGGEGGGGQQNAGGCDEELERACSPPSGHHAARERTFFFTSPRGETQTANDRTRKRERRFSSSAELTPSNPATRSGCCCTLLR